MQAFCAGAGGRLANKWEGGASAFYGVVGVEHLLERAMTTGDFYYGDNAFFDKWRGKLFRFAKNAIQLSTLAKPDVQRLKALDLKLQPWKRGGKHIIVVEQSEHFLGLVGAGGWLQRTVNELQRQTDRPLRISHWSNDKAKLGKSLEESFKGAHALVTHMSAAANEALINGIPVFVTGPCAATPLASGALSEIEKPNYPANREEWAAGLASRQWTLEEMRKGIAWRALN